MTFQTPLLTSGISSCLNNKTKNNITKNIKSKNDKKNKMVFSEDSSGESSDDEDISPKAEGETDWFESFCGLSRKLLHIIRH